MPTSSGSRWTGSPESSRRADSPAVIKAGPAGGPAATRHRPGNWPHPINPATRPYCPHERTGCGRALPGRAGNRCRPETGRCCASPHRGRSRVGRPLGSSHRCRSGSRRASSSHQGRCWAGRCSPSSRRGRSGQGDRPTGSLSRSAGRGLSGRRGEGTRTRLSGCGLRAVQRRRGRWGRLGSARGGLKLGGRTGRTAGGGGARSRAGWRTTTGSCRAGRRCTATTTPAPSRSSGWVGGWRRGGCLAAGIPERPGGRGARSCSGGSTSMVPSVPRSGTGGSSRRGTGGVNDSTSSSLLATIAASDVAASDATARATTTDALRRGDTRVDPLRRRWVGDGPASIGRPVVTLEQFRPIAPSLP
jgi:hypothetical protein